MTDARIGYGSSFSKSDGAGGWTALAEVVNITPPQIARDAVEASHMASTEAWREFVPGLKDGGEVSLELNLIPSGSAISTIMGEFDTNTVSSWRVLFPDGASFVFSGICTGFAPEAPVDNKMAATVTFKISGKPTYAAA